VTGFGWSSAERRAWKPRKRLKPSEWAETHRELPRGQSSRPGRWKNENAAYLRGIMDIADRPGVAEVNIMKAAQVGGSEAIRNLMGCWSDQDPEPMGIALPSREKGRKIVDNRIIPLYADTKVLKSKLTGDPRDVQKGQVKLVDHIIFLMWAGSPTAMSSDPMCRAVCDEVDKFEDWAGKEADPVSLVKKRLVTYEDRAKLINISTPTTRFGRIAELFEASTIKLYFYVPCPHCGHYQRLLFPQVKWPKIPRLSEKTLAARIESEQLAWYECAKCGERIEEEDRVGMVRQGRWQSDDGEIEDAETIEKFPIGTRIGFQISALYAAWVNLSKIASEFIAAKGRLSETFAFRTNTLGEPFEKQLKKPMSGVFEAKSARSTLDEGIVPAWGMRLIATVDTQHNHFWLVIRAWGSGLRSHRVFNSRVETFEELATLCFSTPWAVEGGTSAARMCDAAFIDSGGTKLEGDIESRTMEVYRWCLRTGMRAKPIKGVDRPRAEQFIWHGEGLLRQGQRKARKLRLYNIATHHWNDQLQVFIDDEGGDDRPEPWTLSKKNDPEYNSHMSAVQKIAVRKGNKLFEEWVPATTGARIDYRDCEVYQVAAAHILNVHLLPPQEEIELMREQAQSKRKATKQRPKRDAWSISMPRGI
jgi:phage terminase large subunit GpA-like protein